MLNRFFLGILVLINFFQLGYSASIKDNDPKKENNIKYRAALNSKELILHETSNSNKKLLSYFKKEVEESISKKSMRILIYLLTKNEVNYNDFAFDLPIKTEKQQTVGLLSVKPLLARDNNSSIVIMWGLYLNKHLYTGVGKNNTTSKRKPLRGQNISIVLQDDPSYSSELLIYKYRFKCKTR